MKHSTNSPRRRRILTLSVMVFLAAGLSSARATTKGLSQIVTPDLQVEGELSLSIQAQAKHIANPYQLQAELGITKQFEIAVFQGLEPRETIFGAEVGLIQKEPYLLTAGFINWSTSGQKPQPFIEAGYYLEHDKFIAGPIHVDRGTEVILGYAHDFNKTWRVQVDYQSGTENFVTAGFTCNVTKDFQFNPALYISNDRSHRASGYIVFTYTLPLWHGAKKEPTSQTF